MSTKFARRVAFLFFVLVSALEAQTESVLIRAAKPYTNLVRAIEARGGRVTSQYQNVDGFAAEIQRNRLDEITALAGSGNISKDLVVPIPTSVNTLFGRNLASTGDENRVIADSVQPLGASEIASIASANPAAYTLNNSIINAAPLHASGITGAGIIVAVIDSGIRPGFPHLTLDGSVIGCLDFVGDALGCMSSANDFHGTFVAGMISANVNFIFPAASAFRNAVLAECPACFSNPPTNTVIPMIGTAPLSSIYAFRVFGPTGGAPTSRILAAIDSVITLRKKFDLGQQGGINIKVCNMSLGGARLPPAGDLESAAVASICIGNAPAIGLTSIPRLHWPPHSRYNANDLPAQTEFGPAVHLPRV